MARIEEHCKDCKKFLKNDMYEVHNFLDQYANIFPVGFFIDYHRTFLHNSYGLAIMTATYGEIGKYATILHLTRDYVEGTINHLSLEGIIKEFPRRLMWFDTMQHVYEPKPHIIRRWNGKSIVTLATE